MRFQCTGMQYSGSTGLCPIPNSLPPPKPQSYPLSDLVSSLIVPDNNRTGEELKRILGHLVTRREKERGNEREKQLNEMLNHPTWYHSYAVKCISSSCVSVSHPTGLMVTANGYGVR